MVLALAWHLMGVLCCIITWQMVPKVKQRKPEREFSCAVAHSYEEVVE